MPFHIETIQTIRRNPIVAGSVLGGSVIGGLVVAQTIRKRRKKTKSTVRKRRSKLRAGTKRRKTKKRKVTHRSPRHKGHKRVSFTTKDGKRVNFLVKKKSHTHRRKRRK